MPEGRVADGCVRAFGDEGWWRGKRLHSEIMKAEETRLSRILCSQSYLRHAMDGLSPRHPRGSGILWSVLSAGN
jgi:hypothetical protein